MAESDNRFISLIQPIKDIAANFDIDIAESLTEYLDELENLRISIDGGKTNLNFAEAALLIQGSTAVYSKKVEYLHQLVLQSLELISNKKSNSANNAQSKAGINKSANDSDEFLLLENDESFLLLDHVVEEGRNINLKTSEIDALNNSRMSRSSFSGIAADTSRVSMSLMHSILSDDHGSAGLKLSSSMMDGTGALLICGQVPNNGAGHAHHDQSRGFRASMGNSYAEVGVTGAAVTMGGNHDSFVGNDVDLYDDHDNGDFFGNNDDDAPVPVAGGVTGEEAPQQQSEFLTTPPKQQSSNGAMQQRKHPEPSNSLPEAAVGAGRMNKNSHNSNVDVFAQLDPHLVVTGSRPARRGRTFKIPATLLNPSFNGATSDVAAAAEMMVSHLYSDVVVDSTSSLLGQNYIPTKGLFDTNLLPVLQKKRKMIRQARLAAARQQQQQQHGEAGTRGGYTMHENLRFGSGFNQQQQQLLHLRLQESRMEEVWSQDYLEGGDGQNGPQVDRAASAGEDSEAAAAVAPAFDHHLDDGGDDYYDDGGDIDNNHYYGHDDDDGRGGGGEEEDPHWMAVSEEEALAQRVQNVLNEDLNQSTRTTYESICQKYIDNFSKGAHLFAKETHLSRRVADWTRRLEPILQQQEEARQYDIHDYCEHFILDVDEALTRHHHHKQRDDRDDDDEDVEEEEEELEKEQVGFSEVVAGRSSEEVCRVFLACLQLINQGNISIIPADKDRQMVLLTGNPKERLSLTSALGTAANDAAAEEEDIGALDPFTIRMNSHSHAHHNLMNMERFRAPSIQTVPLKSALKQTSSSSRGSVEFKATAATGNENEPVVGKNGKKTTKRVQMQPVTPSAIMSI